MTHNPDNLFVNIPVDNIEYLFALPNEEIFTNQADAAQARKTGERTVTLRTALAKIAQDIQYDA